MLMLHGSDDLFQMLYCMSCILYSDVFTPLVAILILVIVAETCLWNLPATFESRRDASFMAKVPEVAFGDHDLNRIGIELTDKVEYE